LTILHFNDVYNVEPGGEVGGAARFVTALRTYRHLSPLVLFSGDVFSPSTISTVTKGSHLIDVLKACSIDAACFGNHDFDFGIDNLVQCCAETGFPWLLSNIIDAETGEPLADAREFVCIQHAFSGLKVGIIGLVELEWVDTLSSIDADDIEFFDFCELGEELAKQLKEGPEACDLVLALTHMRWPNDRKLARAARYIDVILGGHDHNYGIEFVNNRLILKSGTDFRQFTVVTLATPSRSTCTTGQPSIPLEIRLETVDVVGSRFAEDPTVAKAVAGHVTNLERSMQRELGSIDCPLECWFSHVRTQETNLGNLFTDIVLTALQADFVLVNSGSFRADCVLPAGPFRLGDLHRVLPMLDPMVVLEIDAKGVLSVLENGVSQWPALEGRFPQVSGIKFRFDGSRPAGSRVDPSSVRIGGRKLRSDAVYRMATKQYLYTGRDGYDMLPNCRLLVDDEEGPIWSVAVQNYFLASAVLHGWQQLHNQRHRHRLISMQRRRTLTGQVSVSLAARLEVVATAAATANANEADPSDETVADAGFDLSAVTDAAGCEGQVMKNRRSSEGSQRAKTTRERWAMVRRRVLMDREEAKLLSDRRPLCPQVEGRIVQGTWSETEEPDEEEEEQDEQRAVDEIKDEDLVDLELSAANAGATVDLKQ
ncbi:hypothetical protein BOX15_Mlig003231g1, partial [Macrostomum lignano]